MHKWLKIVAINLGFIGAAVLLAEVFFGMWLREESIKSLGIATDRTFLFDVERSGKTREISIHYDEWGLRGVYGKPDEIDILTVGGSTTAQRNLGDGETWQDRLEEAFKQTGTTLRIANAGQDGQTSFGNLQNFEKWYPKITGLRPKYILYYVGINDFFLENVGRDNQGWLVKFLRQETLIQETNELRCVTARCFLINNSIIFRVLKDIKGTVLASKGRLLYGNFDFNKAPLTDRPLLANHRDILKNFNTAYVSRLQKLGQKTLEMGAKPIFLTQRPNYFEVRNDVVWGLQEQYGSGDKVYNGVDMYYFFDQIARMTMESCSKTPESLCIDLFRELNLEFSDYDDYVHHSTGGAEKIAQYLYVKFKPHFQEKISVIKKQDSF